MAKGRPKSKTVPAQSQSRGRPVKNQKPESIPDTPENVARACMQGPPKKNWDYLKNNKNR